MVLSLKAETISTRFPNCVGTLPVSPFELTEKPVAIAKRQTASDQMSTT